MWQRQPACTLQRLLGCSVCTLREREYAAELRRVAVRTAGAGWSQRLLRVGMRDRIHRQAAAGGRITVHVGVRSGRGVECVGSLYYMR